MSEGVSQITSGYPAAVQAAAAAVKSQLGTLAGLRDQSLHTLFAASTVIQDYGGLISTLLSFDDQVALSSNDATLTSTARALGAISRSEYEDSVQRAVVMYALTSGSLNANLLQLYNASLANGAADIVDFKDFATTAQQSGYSQALAQSLSDRVSNDEQTIGTIGQDSSNISAAGIAALDWYGAMSDEIQKVHTFEESLANSAVDRSRPFARARSSPRSWSGR